MPFPPEDKTFLGLMKDIQVRLNLIERTLARRGAATSGTTDPTWNPPALGAMYIRTDTKKVYIAVGTASAADWTLMN